MLQKILQFNGIRGHFRPHSFKIGRATDLAKQGVLESEIKPWADGSQGLFKITLDCKCIVSFNGIQAYLPNVFKISKQFG